ncbi:MAG: CCA tRNA nucleotidyltransferase [Clostridia bacterium]|nr:CCA tRNA nucleotidyltransferase [Clostridia bacterium]
MLKIPKKIQYVLSSLQKSGHKAYIVGGCVRDMLMGKTPHDFDITTSANTDEITALFKKTIPTGLKHGTVTVLIENEPIEVTTFRTEADYLDHRHPDTIKFVDNLSEDLSRRDFTVNAIAYNENEGIVDLFGGNTDIKKKILRCVGNPETRFTEDALRILRLFRFASTLNFSIEETTLNAALKMAYLLKKISSERILSELKKAVMGENLEAFSPLINSGALKFLKIENLPNFKIIDRLKTEDLRLFAFLYFASSDLEQTLNILKASNSLKNYCKALKELLSLPVPKNKVDIKILLGKYGTDVLKDYFKIYEIISNENTASLNIILSEIISNNEPYLIKHLEIGGKELDSLGYKGSEIKEKLEFLLEKVIENPNLNRKENLKAILTNTASAP